MDIAQLKKFNEADWNSLTIQGIAYAEKKSRKLRWNNAHGLPKGQQPADIFFTVVEKTLDGIKSAGVTGRKWNESKNPTLLEHLKDGIDSEFSNLVNGMEHQSSEYFKKLDNSEFESKIDKTLSMNVSFGDNDKTSTDKIALLKLELKSDADAIQVIEAFELLSDEEGPLGPQQVASILDMKISDVNNALKRIRRAGDKIFRSNYE